MAQDASVDLERVKALPNLPTHPAPHEDVPAEACQGGLAEAPAPGITG
ncbi:hypothetical protein [Pseudomonas sp. EpS/L25]|nr:hypothetical protein [Pseudomonas sp. EpS/L25]